MKLVEIDGPPAGALPDGTPTTEVRGWRIQWFCIYCGTALTEEPSRRRGVPKPCSDACRAAVKVAAQSFKDARKG